MAASQDVVSLPAKGVRPTGRVIAFAISIVRSKPPELSIGEYIRLLRQHIAKGRRNEAVSAKQAHLDRSSYWRSEYERVNDALKTAENESIALRRQIESLKAKGEVARPTTASKKRKQQDSDVVPYQRSPKRQNREPSPTRNTSLSLDIVDEDFTEAGDVGHTLLYSVFKIHAALKAHNKSGAAQLVHRIIEASTAIPELIQREIKDLVDQEVVDLDRMKSTLTVASRAIMSILTGFTKLNSPGSQVNTGGVTYAIVQMFRDLLAIFEQFPSEEVSQPKVAGTIAGPSDKDAQKSKSKAPKAPSIKENPVLSAYTAFLGNVINMLDSKVDSNKALFEGFAFCILDRLGSSLFCTVFGHKRGESMEDEIGKSRAKKDDGQEDVEAKQATYEAPYLIHLLNRMMAAAPSHLGFAINRKGQPRQIGNGPAKAALAIAAKECLQRTLVNCMFGSEGINDDDPFMECLKMPVAVDGVVQMPKVKDGNAQEWFREEVWRLLGWEILERDADWVRNGGGV